MKMQCKDIPEKPILQFLDDLLFLSRDKYSIGFNGTATQFSEFDNSIHKAFPSGCNNNLIKAKMGQMIKKGLVDGCNCGCRGDYEITEKGKQLLK